MDDWLKKRLTPTKDSEARWVELADALEAYWESHFDPSYVALNAMRSIYTASREDLALRIRELGEFFKPDQPTEYDSPLAVAWRKSEIQRKSREFIITSTFRRNFSGLRVEWVPLYALKTDEYGTAFHKESETVGDEGLYFLTSRGKVMVDLGLIYARQSFTKVEFAEIVEAMVRRIKPEHIVFDGLIFVVSYELDHGIGISGLHHTNHTFTVNYDLDARFDDIPADMKALDHALIGMREFASTQNMILEWPPNVETSYRFDQTPADVMPLDV